MKNGLKILLVAVVSALGLSCSEKSLTPVRPTEGLVLIKAPSSGGFAMSGMTKATKSGGSSDGFDNLFVHSTKNMGSGVNAMKKGTTMWLLVEVPDDEWIRDNGSREYADASEIPEPDRWEESEYSFKPYIVGENGAMYPCETVDSIGTKDEKRAIFRTLKRDANGDVLRSGSALMLPPGLYKFHAVSPASPLLLKLGEHEEPQEISVHVANGEYVQATDVRWRETYPKGVWIPGGTSASAVHSISLPALANQTARIKVNVRCGDDHVRMLGLQKSGIEITGIQEDHHSDFRWTMGDTIKTKIGDKYGGVRFKEYESGKDAEKRDMITAYASILPTDARTNNVYVMFHLIVNNVPTQYMVGLTNQLYEAAHQYEFNFKVRMDENITIGTWDNSTLVYDDLEL